MSTKLTKTENYQNKADTISLIQLNNYDWSDVFVSCHDSIAVAKNQKSFAVRSIS